jgi:hypothetical protein
VSNAGHVPDELSRLNRQLVIANRILANESVALAHKRTWTTWRHRVSTAIDCDGR